MHPHTYQEMPAPPPAQDKFLHVYHAYVFDVTLTANQILDGQLRSIDTDSDFLWRTFTYTSTGAFSVRFADATRYFLSAQKQRSITLSDNGGRPTVQYPEILYPAGSAIQIDLTDLSGAGNTLQLVFKGAKRYRL